MQKSRFLLLLYLTIILTACQSTQAETLTTTIISTVTKDATEIAPSPTPSATKVIPTPTITKTPLPSLTPSKHVSLMAVGDIMLGRTIADMILEEGYQAPFIYTAETLTLADVTVGNLECPISKRGKPIEKKYVFRAPIEAAKALSYAGFDIVSLGNNHILDYGPDALQDTIATLNLENILSVGAGISEEQAYAPAYITVNGLKLAFLSFVDIYTGDFDYLSWEAGSAQPGIAWAHNEKIEKSVQSAKENADIVIVLVHNGYEISQSVSSGQQEVAKLAIDSGASLVIGSHPHVLQRIEPYQDGLIAYSMGNFVFDNFLYPPNYSAILSVELSPQGVESYELIDVVVQLNGVPQIMPYTIEPDN